MAGGLVIVSRQHPDLYVYLRDRFAAAADVAVILDRRVGERRRKQVPAEREHRRRDRRSRPDVDAQLGSLYHVIVKTKLIPQKSPRPMPTRLETSPVALVLEACRPLAAAGPGTRWD
jgi:hypothetical protein